MFYFKNEIIMYTETGYRIIKINANLKLLEIFFVCLLEFYIGY